MLLSGISLLLSLSSIVRSAEIPTLPNCERPHDTGNEEECARPIHDVVAVVPGSHYVAKIECMDCPYKVYVKNPRPAGSGAPESHVLNADHILFLNVTLSHDNRTVLLNEQPIYPLPTIPTPPAFWTKQYSANFSNSDLASALTCPKTNCDILGKMPDECAHWCWRAPIANGRWIHFDYLYITKPSEWEGNDQDDADSEYWDLSVDVFGSDARPDYPAFNFNNPEQKKLWMLIKGTPIRATRENGGGKTASDLFDQIGGDTKVYEYHIMDMRLVARTYTFPARKSLPFFRKIGHFFGTDIWQVPDHRFLYIASEWGDYGKKGTLRNLFGEFTHWEAWDLFWLIVGSVISGLTALFALWRLFWWIVGQRELMKWDGMEHVWENIRRERVVEEEGALLNGEGAYRGGGYRDDPEDGGEGGSCPPAYTDTPTMKPLPAKPLPETPTMKPLPEVPLIDA